MKKSEQLNTEIESMEQPRQEKALSLFIDYGLFWIKDKYLCHEDCQCTWSEEDKDAFKFGQAMKAELEEAINSGHG